MKRLLVVLTLIAFASPALGGCWAEIDPGAFADDCPIIIRGTIISIKDDAIIIKVAPDGIKMEVAKNAIASVTTQESPSAS